MSCCTLMAPGQQRTGSLAATAAAAKRREISWCPFGQPARKTTKHLLSCLKLTEEMLFTHLPCCTQRGRHHPRIGDLKRAPGRTARSVAPPSCGRRRPPSVRQHCQYLAAPSWHQGSSAQAPWLPQQLLPNFENAQNIVVPFRATCAQNYQTPSQLSETHRGDAFYPPALLHPARPQAS